MPLFRPTCEADCKLFLKSQLALVLYFSLSVVHNASVPHYPNYKRPTCTMYLPQLSKLDPAVLRTLVRVLGQHLQHLCRAMYVVQHWAGTQQIPAKFSLHDSPYENPDTIPPRAYGRQRQRQTQAAAGWVMDGKGGGCASTS